jgi:hypothetical protein
MIRVAKTLGAKPVFVYMGTCDTTFEISDSFWYEEFVVLPWISDTVWYDVLALRKSLYYDAYCFAQYLFGDPATDTTGWAERPTARFRFSPFLFLCSREERRHSQVW